jgi:hypothetical protein
MNAKKQSPFSDRITYFSLAPLSTDDIERIRHHLPQVILILTKTMLQFGRNSSKSA